MKNSVASLQAKKREINHLFSHSLTLGESSNHWIKDMDSAGLTVHILKETSDYEFILCRDWVCSWLACGYTDGGNTSPVNPSSDETSLQSWATSSMCPAMPSSRTEHLRNLKARNATITSRHIKHNTYFIDLISKEVKNQMKEDLHSIISTIYEE